MRRLRALVSEMALLTGTAHAGVSGTVTATNDYDFRGISQSATDIALQGSLDWAHDSGFFLGAWASNVDFSSPGADFKEDIEVDLYTRRHLPSPPQPPNSRRPQAKQSALTRSLRFA